MKKIIFLLAVVAMATISCNKQKETIEFNFITTNPWERPAEVGGNIQTFAFVSPNDWNISWTPVDWITLDETQLTGKASVDAKDVHVITMHIDDLRKNEDRTIEFGVKEGNAVHIMTIIQKAPVLPEEPLKLGQEKFNNPAGGSYDFTVPDKYEITVKSNSDWITITDVDFEKNIVKFNVDALSEPGKRTGIIEVLLSNGILLGSATIEQEKAAEE